MAQLADRSTTDESRCNIDEAGRDQGLFPLALVALQVDVGPQSLGVTLRRRSAPRRVAAGSPSLSPRTKRLAIGRYHPRTQVSYAAERAARLFRASLPLCDAGTHPSTATGWLQAPKPRKTRSRLSTSTNVVASSLPTTERTLLLLTVVSLSTIRQQSWPRPFASSAVTGRRSKGASTSVLVKGQTVKESVASNRSSWMIRAGRGLLA